MFDVFPDHSRSTCFAWLSKWLDALRQIVLRDSTTPTWTQSRYFRHPRLGMCGWTLSTQSADFWYLGYNSSFPPVQMVSLTVPFGCSSFCILAYGTTALTLEFSSTVLWVHWIRWSPGKPRDIGSYLIFASAPTQRYGRSPGVLEAERSTGKIFLDFWKDTHSGEWYSVGFLFASRNIFCPFWNRDLVCMRLHKGCLWGFGLTGFYFESR